MIETIYDAMLLTFICSKNKLALTYTQDLRNLIFSCNVTTKLTGAPIFLNFIRHAHMKCRIKWKDAQDKFEGVKYGHVTYFPRYVRLYYIVSILIFSKFRYL